MEDASAISIYNILKDFFENANIDYKSNLVGIGADGAAVMTGVRHSVAILLKNDCKDLKKIKCACHSLALCSSYTCKHIPNDVEKCLKDIYSFLSRSSKRTSEFNKIQHILELKPLKMLHPSQTRWLSLEAIVKRILECLEPLKMYFATIEDTTNDGPPDKGILEVLTKTTTEAYLKFLKFILAYINKLNRMFQSEEPQVHKIYSSMLNTTKIILDFFIKRNVVHNCRSNFSEIDFDDESNFIPLNEMFVGTECTESIEEIAEHEEKYELLLNLRKFYSEIIVQICRRFHKKLFNN